MRCLQLIAAVLAMTAFEAACLEIRVNGNNRVTKETIEMYSELRDNGQKVNLDDAVRKIYATGFFSDVKIEKNAGVIVINVVENPTVRKVVFEGNYEFSDEKLYKLIRLQSRDVYSANGARSDALSVQKFYEAHGYHAAAVMPQIIKLEQNRIDLVYNISEGVVAKIKEINFIGNENFSSKELSNVILSKKRSLFRFFSSADVYNTDKLKLDQELLKRHYLSNGYFGFRINSVASEINAAKDGIFVTFLLEEGVQYKLADIRLESQLEKFSANDLLSKIQLTKGALLTIDSIEIVEEAISEYLRNNGHALTSVSHEVIRDPESKTATVVFKVGSGGNLYIGRININNNTRTMEKVIRRELETFEGDQYNLSRIERSRISLANIGYFSNVELKNVQTGPDRIDINLDVKEAPTGAVDLSFGYSDEVGALAGISFVENNFLGKGQSLELALRKSHNSGSASLGFTEPYFLNRPIAAGFDIYASRSANKYSSYSSHSLGFDLRARYRLINRFTHGLRYNFSKSSVSDVENKHTSKENKINKLSSLISRDLQGKVSYVSSVGHTLSWDSLDSFYKPSSGASVQFLQDVAGLGGNANYLKNQATGQLYIPLYKRLVVLNLAARAGSIRGTGGKKVHLLHNFHLGQEYLRGFEPHGISPREGTDADPFGDAIGAKTFYSATAEVSFPIGLPEEFGVNGVFFFDAATAFGYDLSDKKLLKSEKSQKIFESKALRSSCGLGVVWYSPIGKMQFYYGVPIKKEPFDITQRFSISLGGML